MKDDTLNNTDTQTEDPGLELYWEHEVTVLVKDGDDVKEVQEVIKIPRLTTRMMLVYRRELKKRFAGVLMDVEPGDQGAAMLKAGLDVEALGETIIDIMLPGLLDRLHPDSFDTLTQSILEVEKKILNPQPTKPKKGGKKKSTKGKKNS